MSESINYRGLSIPRVPLGREITSDNLFGPNEQVIFDFYEANKSRYKRVVDIGANIGVHSMLMARNGWIVRAFEPDPDHFQMLRANIGAHGVSHLIECLCAAVSDRTGTAEFVRVLDNLTGSHIVGAKDSYGPREKIKILTVDCRPLFEWADFIKMDCEGHEAVIITAVPKEVMGRTDVLLEVGSFSSAAQIYKYLRYAVPMWSQKIGWRRVQSVYDMPVRHQDGSLFIGVNPPFKGSLT